MKTVLAVVMVVVGFALVLTLALAAFAPVLDRYSGSRDVGSRFSSCL